ncbi:MAG TPA: response regulator transcription factor [Bryobacteraceae bacterium]
MSNLVGAQDLRTVSLLRKELTEETPLSKETTLQVETLNSMRTAPVPAQEPHITRQQQVLVVEDEELVALDLERCLEALGYGVTIATNGPGATVAIRRRKPDLVLMDIGLDGAADGIDLADVLRKETDAAVIFLTAYSDRQTVERAAQVEPSGYIVKPFHEQAVAAAVHLALHRLRSERRIPPAGASSPAQQAPASTIRVGQVNIDMARHRIVLDGREVQVTKKEFGILQFLAERAGTPIEPEAILERVWGAQFAHYIQTLRVHIGNLRHKIETPASGVAIEAVRGIGYRLVESLGSSSIAGN